ncbi:MAG: winged helix-turn-helix transcriptional regulator [Candidatus Aenigmarchaeota archaeon]|nr:winged helix-turn-helix transcriptional regulator [Candidatus Aenigmarchaeota archaeon]
MGNTRKAILDAVAREPGSSISGLASALRIPRTTASYQLHKLEEDGLLAELDASSKERYYAYDTPEDRLRAKARIVASNENAVRILEYCSRRSVQSRAGIARELGLSNPTIAWHVQRLKRLGLVSELSRRHYVTDDGRQVLTTIQQERGMKYGPV